MQGSIIANGNIDSNGNIIPGKEPRVESLIVIDKTNTNQFIQYGKPNQANEFRDFDMFSFSENRNIVIQDFNDAGDKISLNEKLQINTRMFYAKYSVENKTIYRKKCHQIGLVLNPEDQIEICDYQTPYPVISVEGRSSAIQIYPNTQKSSCSKHGEVV
jgi:hypothetical protein